MNGYHIQRLWVNRSASQKKQWEALLNQGGIRAEDQVTYTVGVYQGESLVATGSLYQNVLKCMAVDENHTGGEVISLLTSHLLSEVFLKGYGKCYVYTKPESSMSFSYMGFKEIERVEGKLVFLEKAVSGFTDFIDKLKQMKVEGEKVAGIVMNANPFTLGHLYLIENAAKENDVVHLFILTEDLSAFPSSIRKELVIQGTKHLKNVQVHDTGDYMVSAKTFPSYFLKEDEDVTRVQATLDALIFKNHIAKALGITRRYVGEEPMSFATNIYNEALKETFKDDLELVILKRKEMDTDVISASRVRANLKEGKLDMVKALVPKTTFDFLLTEEGKEIIQKIQDVK